MHIQPAETITSPIACPFCDSVDITTTSKEVNVSTYWRCTACGQIWNAGRLQHSRPLHSDAWKSVSTYTRTTHKGHYR